MSKKIVLIGGGSYAWSPTIVRDMMLTEGLSDAHFVLYDINLKAAELIERYLNKINQSLKTPARFTATNQLEKAFEGADYFIITISTGGLDAMEHDILIPEKYGIFHTVGDTSGPGGWARFIRNYGVFKNLSEAINRYAPGAMVLNYTNPMTTLTQVMSQICNGPVVGLCHGLFENLAFLKQFYKVESEDDISVNYAGLNHFFWITEANIKGIYIIADLKERLQKQSLTELMRDCSPDPMGFTSNRELAMELFKMTGIMPYLGDRHTCEFFPQYITSQKNMEKYKLVRTSIQERRDEFIKRATRIENIVSGKIEPINLTRSRETAADIIVAHSQGKPFIDVGNLPNIGQIANLPLGTVVETAVRVDRNGFSPIAFGPLPEPMVSFILPFANSFNLVVDACKKGNRKQALDALRIDPICSHLNCEQVLEMGNALLEVHAPFIEIF